MPSEIAKAHQCAPGEGAADCGCAFVVEAGNPGPDGGKFCNAPRAPASAYCPRHHALCHLPKGSAAEQRQLCEIEALAQAVGGRRGRETQQPPDRVLRRLNRIAQAFSRLNCS
jgi:hypothetical protein